MLWETEAMHEFILRIWWGQQAWPHQPGQDGNCLTLFETCVKKLKFQRKEASKLLTAASSTIKWKKEPLMEE